MKKILSILFVLALVLSFSLVATTPVAAQVNRLVPSEYPTIQEAINAANPGDTIIVAAGPHAGANVNKGVAIVGAVGGGSVITSGVPFRDSHTLTTAFRIFPGAHGVEIRNFTVECDSLANFFFAVFSRAADDVIVDSLIINGPIQGITNWGGSDWEITGNEISYTEASGGGGIGIMVGTVPPDFPVASGNLIEGNSIIATATAPDFSTPGILVSLDLRWGAYDDLTGDEDVSGNQILNNIVTGNGAVYSHGVQIGVLGLGGDPDKIAATMGIIDDTLVQGNTISGTDFGMYFYTVSNLVVHDNVIADMNRGILMYDGNQDNTINYNSIYGNTDFGLYNNTGVAVDATLNWWGDASGPAHASNPGTGDAVSDNVDFDPWLMEEDGAETTQTDTDSGVDAKAETDNVSAQATGGGTDTTVSVAEYVGNPTAVDPGFEAGAVFFDVHVGGSLPYELVVKFKCPGGECSGMILKWFDGTEWLDVSQVSYTNGEIVATLSAASSPTIAQLTGTPFALGNPTPPPAPVTVGWEGSAVNKAAVMAPWLALLATMMAGATLLAARRRRAQI